MLHRMINLIVSRTYKGKESFVDDSAKALEEFAEHTRKEEGITCGEFEASNKCRVRCIYGHSTEKEVIALASEPAIEISLPHIKAIKYMIRWDPEPIVAEAKDFEKGKPVAWAIVNSTFAEMSKKDGEFRNFGFSQFQSIHEYHEETRFKTVEQAVGYFEKFHDIVQRLDPVTSHYVKYRISTNEILGTKKSKGPWKDIRIIGGKDEK